MDKKPMNRKVSGIAVSGMLAALWSAGLVIGVPGAVYAEMSIEEMELKVQAMEAARDREAARKAEEEARQQAERAARKKAAAAAKRKAAAQAERKRAAKRQRESSARAARDLAGKFIKIQPGCFQMGSPTSESGRDDDETRHRVCLTQHYELGQYEVTQGQWEKVMGSNPSHFSDCGSNCPVEQVSWNDVQEFIRKLNRKTGRRYRLPTEAEWEYACRSGGRDEKYCGGNDVNSLGWTDDNSGHKTHRVGQKRANGLGLYDMSGNVSEWVEDWYGSYPSSSVTDPKGPSSGSGRVGRGGSWSYYARDLRSADRNFLSPDYRYVVLGFRLARTL